MASWVAEWARAGDGDAVVVGSNPARSMDFFSRSKNLYIFWRASCQYSKHKISGTVTGTVATAYYYNLTCKLTVTAWVIC